MLRFRLYILTLALGIGALNASALDLGLGLVLGKGSNIAIYENLLHILSWGTITAFPDTAVGSSATKSVVLSNTGNYAAEDVAITTTAPFSLYSTTLTGDIAAGSSRTVKLRFTPPSDGTFGGFVNYSAPNIAKVGLALSGVGTGMSSYFDAFTRPDEDPLTGWTIVTGKVKMKIVSNMAAATTTGDSYMWYSTAASNSDQFSKITIGVMSDYLTVGARMQPAARTGYWAQARTNDTILLYKVVAGTQTAMAGSGAAAGKTIAAGDTLEIRVTGDTTPVVKVLFNGVEKISATDAASPVTGGAPMMGINQTTGRISRWDGGNI